MANFSDLDGKIVIFLVILHALLAASMTNTVSTPPHQLASEAAAVTLTAPLETQTDAGHSGEASERTGSACSTNIVITVKPPIKDTLKEVPTKDKLKVLLYTRPMENHL